MVLDTSALVAILQDEPERRSFIRVIDEAQHRAMSVVSFVETSMVLASRYGQEGVRDLDLLIARAGIDLEPVDERQARLARSAFRNYGKRRHPANLNFGDCFPYALAKALGEPLLFKGEDFGLTDVSRVVLPS